MADHGDIDTEMYLRDGAPWATVCKVQMTDGQVGIGIFRQDQAATGSLDQQAADKAALDDALENLHGGLEADQAAGRAFTVTDDLDHDLQASLGQKAHE